METIVSPDQQLKPPLWRRLVDELLETPGALDPGAKYSLEFLGERLGRSPDDRFMFGDIIDMNRVLEIQRAVLLSARKMDGEGYQVLSISESLDRSEEWTGRCRDMLRRCVRLTGAVQLQDVATQDEKARALKLNEKQAMRLCMFDRPKTIMAKLGATAKKMISDGKEKANGD